MLKRVGQCYFHINGLKNTGLISCLSTLIVCFEFLSAKKRRSGATFSTHKFGLISFYSLLSVWRKPSVWCKPSFFELTERATTDEEETTIMALWNWKLTLIYNEFAMILAMSWHFQNLNCNKWECSYFLFSFPFFKILVIKEHAIYFNQESWNIPCL